MRKGIALVLVGLLLCGVIPVVLAPCVIARAEAKTVNPVPATLTLDALDGRTFHAGFEPADVYLDDEGALVVHLTIFDYDRFDPGDIERLAAGDTIVVCQQSIPVDTVALTEGAMEINGGIDNEGVTLWLSDEGYYTVVLENDAHEFFTVGEATLPIGPDFVLKDSWDLDQPEQTILAKDFLAYMQDAAESDDRYLGFSAHETEVTVTDGYIVSMEHYYAF